MRGRRPKPDNFRSGDSPTPLGPVPEPPEWLDTDAKTFWRRLGPRLHARALLTADTMDAFAAMAQCYAAIQHASATLREDGLLITTLGGMTRINPVAPYRNACFKEFRAYASEFGLTPRSRTDSNDASPIGDDLDTFLDN